MQSDDTFRRAFEATVLKLTAWAEAQRDAALVDHEATAEFWRVALRPHAHNACPVELILHRPTQTFDVQIANEAWEAQPVRDLETFEPLLAAVVSGDVVAELLASATTGVPLRVRMTVGAGRAAVVFERDTAAGTRLGAAGRAASVARDQHWVPYRRA